MRSFPLVVVLAALAACGSPPAPTGAFHLTWSLTDSTRPGSSPSCTGYRVSAVRLTVDDGPQVIDGACADGAIDAPSVKAGAHTLRLEAIGELGDTAGTATLNGTIGTKGETVTLDPVAIDTLAPTTTLRPAWQLMANGHPTTCTALASTGVRIDVTPQNSVATVDLFNCEQTSSAALVSVAYGSFTASASVLGAGDVVLSTSPTQSFAPQRGEVPATFTIGN